MDETTAPGSRSVAEGKSGVARPPAAGTPRRRLKLGFPLPGLAGDSLKRRLARGALSAFVINVAATGVAFLAQLVLARVLGAYGYGVYAYVTAWVTVLVLLATLGFQTGLLRFASAYAAREEWPLLRGVIRYAEVRVVAAGSAIGIATAGVVVALGERLAPELSRAFLVGCAIIPVLALLQVRSSIVRAFGRVLSALAPQTLVRHAVVLVVVGLGGVVFSLAIGPAAAMAVTLLGTVVGLAMVSFAIRGARPAAMASAVAAYDAPEWRRAWLALLSMAGTRMVLARADLLILGWLADISAVGVYAAASRTAALVSFTLTATNTIFAPQIAALYAQGDRSSLQAMVTTTAWWTTLSALVIAVPLFALAEVVLSMFGASFTSGVLAFRILLIGQVVNAAAGSVGNLLTMTGHERQAAVILGVAAAAQVGLAATLIPWFGLEGAALSATLTMTGWNLAMAILGRRISRSCRASSPRGPAIMRVPDFFIIGAPKCGTTALHSYLRDHPRIFMPERKEIHFFCEDLNFPRRSSVRDRDEYLGLFAAATDDMLIGEGSASYLYSDVAVAKISDGQPERQVDRDSAQSGRDGLFLSFSTSHHLNEDFTDFRAAWSLQANRRNGMDIPQASE